MPRKLVVAITLQETKMCSLTIPLFLLAITLSYLCVQGADITFSVVDKIQEKPTLYISVFLVIKIEQDGETVNFRKKGENYFEVLCTIYDCVLVHKNTHENDAGKKTVMELNRLWKNENGIRNPKETEVLYANSILLDSVPQECQNFPITHKNNIILIDDSQDFSTQLMFSTLVWLAKAQPIISTAFKADYIQNNLRKFVTKEIKGLSDEKFTLFIALNTDMLFIKKTLFGKTTTIFREKWIKTLTDAGVSCVLYLREEESDKVVTTMREKNLFADILTWEDFSVTVCDVTMHQIDIGSRPDGTALCIGPDETEFVQERFSLRVKNNDDLDALAEKIVKVAQQYKKSRIAVYNYVDLITYLPILGETKLPTLAIDIDETLVRTVAPGGKRNLPIDKYKPITVDNSTFYVLPRPHVDTSLETLMKEFELVLFTAGKEKYAQKILELFNLIYPKIKFAAVYAHTHISDHKKDTRFLGRENVYLIDNHADNGVVKEKTIEIQDFYDTEEWENDKAWLDLTPELIHLAEGHRSGSPTHHVVNHKIVPI